MSVMICVRRPTPRVCVRVLAHEIMDKPKKLPTRFGKICICGMQDTGKKTLAHRFGNMDQGPFQAEIPSRYYYTAHFNLDQRANVRGIGEVKLEIILLPQSHDLPEPEEFFNRALHYNAMLFLYSVTDIHSFGIAIDCIRDLKRIGLLPYYQVVGNKMDLDRMTDFQDFPITADFASNVSRNFGADYFECSALQNIAVDPIVDAILQSIVDFD